MDCKSSGSFGVNNFLKPGIKCLAVIVPVSGTFSDSTNGTGEAVFRDVSPAFATSLTLVSCDPAD